MLVRILGIEDVVAGNLANRDAVRKLARHHDEVTDLYRVGVLVELRGEVPESVPPPVWHHLRKMFQDGVTVGEAPQVTATFRRKDGRTLHVRKATRAEPEQQKIFRALGTDPAPGGIRKMIV